MFGTLVPGGIRSSVKLLFIGTAAALLVSHSSAVVSHGIIPLVAIKSTRMT